MINYKCLASGKDCPFRKPIYVGFSVAVFFADAFISLRINILLGK